MKNVLMRSEKQLTIRYSRKSAQYVIPIKISSIRSINELVTLIKNNKQVEDGPPDTIVVDIRKKSL
jgi:hypothetical protein